MNKRTLILLIGLGLVAGACFQGDLSAMGRRERQRYGVGNGQNPKRPNTPQPEPQPEQRMCVICQEQRPVSSFERYTNCDCLPNICNHAQFDENGEAQPSCLQVMRGQEQPCPTCRNEDLV